MENVLSLVNVSGNNSRHVKWVALRNFTESFVVGVIGVIWNRLQIDHKDSDMPTLTTRRVENKTVFYSWPPC